jgi:VIT1/CCC1 family predicted Fe2+/Mn2+ transporter
MNNFISELVYGGMDGVITTIAIIGAAIGAQLDKKYIAIIASSSLLADGLSMGVSRYNSLVDNNVCKICSGFATFFFFLLFGMIPLIPFFMNQSRDFMIKSFLFLSFLSFIFIGLFKGIVDNNILSNIFGTLLLGGGASFLSYYVAKTMKYRLM